MVAKTARTHEKINATWWNDKTLLYQHFTYFVVAVIVVAAAAAFVLVVVKCVYSFVFVLVYLYVSAGFVIGTRDVFNQHVNKQFLNLNEL